MSFDDSKTLFDRLNLVLLVSTEGKSQQSKFQLFLSRFPISTPYMYILYVHIIHHLFPAFFSLSCAKLQLRQING